FPTRRSSDLKYLCPFDRPSLGFLEENVTRVNPPTRVFGSLGPHRALACLALGAALVGCGSQDYPTELTAEEAYPPVVPGNAPVGVQPGVDKPTHQPATTAPSVAPQSPGLPVSPDPQGQPPGGAPVTGDFGATGAAGGPAGESGAPLVTPAAPLPPEELPDSTDVDGPLPEPTITVNPFVTVAHDPLSTFGVDVDTASYDIFRRDVLAGFLPSPQTVRLEEIGRASCRERV